MFHSPHNTKTVTTPLGALTYAFRQWNPFPRDSESEHIMRSVIPIAHFTYWERSYPSGTAASGKSPNYQRWLSVMWFRCWPRALAARVRYSRSASYWHLHWWTIYTTEHYLSDTVRQRQRRTMYVTGGWVDDLRHTATTRTPRAVEGLRRATWLYRWSTWVLDSCGPVPTVCVRVSSAVSSAIIECPVKHHKRKKFG